ncbi:hypothetical protein F4Z99_18640 [Candidatus Poribacteria bacterium]|nr:hypothetical protein [Candidatus Poribacteria bacterium]MYB01145.1 hypothetical protein [Candidatus Poribacteria bacterium]
MKYPFMKRFTEMVKRMGKTLNEVFAVVPNSFQQYWGDVQKALSDDPPDDLHRDDWLYMEALIGDSPDQVLLECYKADGGRTYYLYDIAFEDGTVKWSNQREVEVEAYLKAKPVMESRLTKVVDPPEELIIDQGDGQVVINVTEGAKFGYVEIAQKADVRNRNNRIYPKDVLQDAVERFKRRIRETGAAAMETMHREERFIGDVCALIHDVVFNESTGVVSLPKIEFVDTQSGKDVMTLLDAGLEFQVSQRGYGFSHEEIDPVTGMKVQIMDWLKIDGFDLVWNGDASVEDAALSLNETVNAQQQQSAEPTNEGGSDLNQQQQQSDPPPQEQEPPVRSPYFSGRSNERGNPTQGNPSHHAQEQQQQQQQQQPPQQQEMLNKEVVSLVQTAVEQLMAPLERKYVTETTELRQKDFVRTAEQVIDDVLSQHPRFSAKQKEAIKSGVNVGALFSEVDSIDTSSITRVLTPVLEREIEQADKLIATDEVNGWRIPNGNPNVPYINNAGGVTFVDVVNDGHIARIFEGQVYETLIEGTIDEMTRNNRQSENNPDGPWVMPVTDPGMKVLASVMDTFIKEKAPQLANETQVAGLGIPINQLSMLLVPVVWRMTTFMQMAQLHPMQLVVEDIPVEKWTGQQANVNDWERWNALDPGDSAVIPESVLNYEDYRLAVGYQPQHVRVTPKTRAMTRNTVMNPIMRSTALAAREVINQNDLTGWRALIMEAMKLDHVKVSTWTALSRIGSSDEYTVRDGLIPYEWIVTEDSNDNVAKSGLVRNYPADGQATAPSIVQRVLQPLELQEGAGDNTPLLYDTDYTVDWVKGTIKLTTAGRSKASTANGVRAKYSYATNISVWDATVPAGSTFIDHLLDLRLKVADVRVKVKNRHYEPECLAMNYELMDKLSAGKNFTNEGTNAAQSLDVMSNVLRYAGSDVVNTTAIPKEYLICGQKMSLLFGVHTPFHLTGAHITDNTGDQRHFGEQFAGMGVPAPEKVSVCIVKNLP